MRDKGKKEGWTFDHLILGVVTHQSLALFLISSLMTLFLFFSAPAIFDLIVVVWLRLCSALLCSSSVL